MKCLQTGWRWMWLMPLLVVLDQLSKWWLLKTIPWGESRVLTSWLTISHVHNYGIAFSLFNRPGVMVWFFLLLACAVMVGLGVWLWRLPARPASLPVSLVFILSGALGNVLDRLQHGFVVDFIDVHWHQWHWPAFNVADSLVCLGVLGLVVYKSR